MTDDETWIWDGIRQENWQPHTFVGGQEPRRAKDVAWFTGFALASAAAIVVGMALVAWAIYQAAALILWALS